LVLNVFSFSHIINELRDLMKKSIFLHNLLHVFLPLFLLYIIVRVSGKINLTYSAISVFTGSFFPDIDHLLIYKKKVYKSFFKFLKFCLRAERFRRGFLIFHNDLALLFIAVSIIIFKFLNFYFMLFLFSFFFHLVYDYLSDIILIKTYKHWRFKWI
jgi:hypothetical protein